MVSIARSRLCRDNWLIIQIDNSAEDALRKGLDDLIDLCDVVADKFTAAREQHASQMES